MSSKVINTADKFTVRIAAIVAALMLISVVYLGAFLNPYVLNFPFWDDYSVILDFALQWFSLPSWWDRIHLLFSPHNEHIIGFGRMIVLLQVYFLGRVDFQELFLFALLGIAATVFAVLSLRSNRTSSSCSLLTAVISIALIVNPMVLEVIIWATPAISVLWVVPFALLTFKLFSNPTAGRVIFGLALATVSFLTNGNGILVFPCLVAMLVVSPKLTLGKRVFLSSIVLVNLWILFLLFKTGHLSSSLDANFGRASNSLIELFSYMFAFIGGPFAFWSTEYAIWQGAVICAIAGIVICMSVWRSNPALLAGLLFCFGSAAANSLVRAQNGAIAAISSRYQFTAVVAMALCIVAFDEMVCQRTKLRKLSRVALTISALLYSSVSFWFTPPLLTSFRAGIVYPALEWAVDHEKSAPAAADRDEATRILLAVGRSALNDRPLYVIPYDQLAETLYPKRSFNSLPREDLQLEFAFDSIIQNSDLVSVFGWAAMPKSGKAGTKLWITFTPCSRTTDPTRSSESNMECGRRSSGSAIVAFLAQRVARPDVSAHFSTLLGQDVKVDQSGFAVRVATKSIPSGLYQMGLLVVDKQPSGSSFRAYRNTSKIFKFGDLTVYGR